MKKWYEDSSTSGGGVGNSGSGNNTGSNSSGQFHHYQQNQNNQLSAQHKTTPYYGNSSQVQSNEYPLTAARGGGGNNLAYLSNNSSSSHLGFYDKISPYSAAHYGLSNGYSMNSNYHAPAIGSSSGYGGHHGSVHAPQAQYPLSYGGHHQRQHYQHHQHPYHSSNHHNSSSGGHLHSGSYHPSDYYYPVPSSLDPATYPFQTSYCETSSRGISNGSEPGAGQSGSRSHSAHNINGTQSNVNSGYPIPGFNGGNVMNSRENYLSHSPQNSSSHDTDISGNYPSTSSSSSFYFPSEDGNSQPENSSLPPPPPLINSTNIVDKIDQEQSEDQGQLELQSQSETRTSQIPVESGNDTESSVGYKYNQAEQVCDNDKTSESRESSE